MNHARVGGAIDFFNSLLMQWSIKDAAHRDFPEWAYSILKPTIEIERHNALFAPMGRYFKLEGGPYYFKDRGPDGKAVKPPTEIVESIRVPGDPRKIENMLKHLIFSFTTIVANYGASDSADDLIQLREVLRRLGFEPDPNGEWDAMAADILEYYALAKSSG